ncbi:MAG: TfoX/Sxy family protein, partial [Firmicutes bacterium]|nr:TfoX/Sxy family protein [Bacillota bacterium]
MASTKQYLDYILENLPLGASHRAMMGEYIIYYNGKVIGGIYDDRFLIKPTESARALMPDAAYELPYEGAKEMLLADNVDDSAYLCGLMEAIYPDLPE